MMTFLIDSKLNDFRVRMRSTFFPHPNKHTRVKQGEGGGGGRVGMKKPELDTQMVADGRRRSAVE